MASDITLFEGEKPELGFEKIFSAKDLRIIECDESSIRGAVEQRRADIIMVSEKNPRDSLHFRRTALDSVICSIAARNGIAFAFSFSAILNARNRPLILGRIMQNIRLCRKHKVKMIFASFARNKWEMRAPEELRAFARTLGMTAGESNDALNSIPDIIASKNHKIKGVRIIE